MARCYESDWDFTPDEAELFLGAYTFDFGNVARAALLRRSVNAAKSPKRKVLPLHFVEGQVPVTLSDKLVQGMLEELDSKVYANPDQFPNGEQLLFLVDSCKTLLLEQDERKKAAS